MRPHALRHAMQDEPFAFGFPRVANFEAIPCSGTLAPGGESTLLMRFSPHQLGTLSATLPLLGFGGAVSSQNVLLSGSCTEAPHRMARHGTAWHGMT